MSDIQDLYQEVVVDHYQHPRNAGTLAHPNRRAEGYNPLCGDQIKLQLTVEDDRITDIAFNGNGCAISTASASVMTESLKGKTVAEAEALFKQMMEMLTGDAAEAAEVAPEMGKLAVFSGVREYPMRVKCASLAWHTLHAALANREEPVSTEGAVPD